MQRHWWRMLVSAGLLAMVAHGYAQEDLCESSSVLATFQAAVEANGIDTWAQSYSECSEHTRRGVNELVRGYDALTFEAPEFETVRAFDGEDDYAEVPFADAFNLTKFTLEVWVYPEEIRSDWQPIAAKEGEDGSYRNYGMFIVPNTMLVHTSLYGDDCTDNYWFSSHEPLVLNSWNHLAMTYDGEAIRFYLNGALDTEFPYSGGACQSEQPLYFGGHPGLFALFRGQMTEARLWDRPLSEQEIGEGMYATLAGDEHGLVGYWRLDDSEGNTIRDSASGNDGVMLAR